MVLKSFISRQILTEITQNLKRYNIKIEYFGCSKCKSVCIKQCKRVWPLNVIMALLN